MLLNFSYSSMYLSVFILNIPLAYYSYLYLAVFCYYNFVSNAQFHPLTLHSNSVFHYTIYTFDYSFAKFNERCTQNI